MAIRFFGKRGERRDLTYADLDRETARFANALGSLGVERGDRVFILAGRVPELYVAALGTLRFGAVFCPLFSAFGPPKQGSSASPTRWPASWSRRSSR